MNLDSSLDPIFRLFGTTDCSTDIGTHTMDARADDPYDGNVTTTKSFTVNQNFPPTLATNQVVFPIGTAVSQILSSAVDSGTEVFTYTVKNLNNSAISLPWFSFNPATREVSGMVSVVFDTFDIQYCVTDSWNPRVCSTLTLISNSAPYYDSFIRDYSFLV